MRDLRELCEEHYFRLNQRIRDEKTRKQYRIALADFEHAVGSRPTLDDLSDDNICRLIVFLQNRHLAVKTVNERVGRITALWRWLAKRGHVTCWPTTVAIPEPERVPVAWMRDDLARLFAAFDSERVLISGVPSPDWWRSLHFVFWDSGERISALLQCEWSHLDGDWLVVPAELRKARRRDMAYLLAGDTIAALERIREPARSRIWPWPYSPDYLWTRYRIIRRRAGLPTDRRSSFHRMRKSVASHFAAAGGDAMELFQHCSRKVTMRYLDPRIVRQPQAVDLLFRPV